MRALKLKNVLFSASVLVAAKVAKNDAFKNGDFENVYKSVKNEELESKDILVGFEKDYPQVAKESNINDILKTLKGKRNNNAK